MPSFLDNLTDVLGQQLNAGDNKLSTLNTTDSNGNAIQNGRLGKFANQIDNSAQRSYTEAGYHRNDLFNPKVNSLNILYQEPDFTVLIKKRAFSSLAENYRNDMINDEERLFVRATKFLFQNKARQISAYEKLTKIAQITNKTQTIDDALLPTIFSATDVLSGVPELGGSEAFSAFKGVVDRVRTLYNLSDDALTTTWIVNPDDSFVSSLGTGTGILELTTATSVSTNVSIRLGEGSASLSFSDPLKLMQITNNDLEQAIADATNAILGADFVQLGLDVLGTTIAAAKKKLNDLRVARSANPIIFTVNPDTYLGQRVVALVDISGINIKFEGNMLDVNIDPLYTQDIGVYGKQSLLGEESETFKLIIRSLYNQLQINKNSQTTQRAHNKSTNGLRKKMRLHYGGQLVIQPMDVVHIYASSKTRVDNKVLGGLQESISGIGFLQSVNKNLMNVEDFFDASKDDSIEKSVFVGADFPNWLWLLLRNQFTASKSGTHIFAGIVSGTTHTYSGNKFSVDISIRDNSHYFELGIFNYKPSANVFNGSLYDPLTPFDIKFNNVSGLPPAEIPTLLPENIKLFEGSVFAKYKNGIYVGKKPSINNFISDSERIKNGSTRRVFYDPDGMVYKWKEGIGALVMFGNNYEDNPSSQTGNASVTADPFAGQDIMNVLSLLITGEPYNFATFYQAATTNSDYGRDPLTNEDPANAYFRNLQKDLKSRNTMYGNFIPFKTLTMDQEAYIKTATAQVRANQVDQQLNQLLADRADLQDLLNVNSNGGFDTGLNTAGKTNDLAAQVKNLSAQINIKISQSVTALNDINSPITLVGNDITLDPTGFNTGSNKNDQSDTTAAVRLQKKLNYLTRRLAWKVRNNEDLNFFIVDDTYDKDYDIQAFEKHFTNAELFRSDYVSVKSQIERVAKLFDLEIFANTQGHIEIRPPKYNRIPSSIFYRMMRLQREFDIQLYPEFLEDLFVNQLNSALKQIEILEDELRLYGIALGYVNDTDAAQFFSRQAAGVTQAIWTGDFAFVSDSNGNIDSVSFDELSSADDPESQLSAFDGKLTALSSIDTQAKINNIFSTAARASSLTNTNILSNGSSLSRQTDIINRLYSKTGVKFDMSQIFSGSKTFATGIHVSAVELLRAYNEIGNKIGTRQRLLKISSTAIKNAKAGLALMQNKGGSADNLFSAGLIDNSQIPQALQYMLEDEGYDDYGPGSGKRYIIKNEQVKRFTINNNAPSATAITVQGSFADNFEVSLPSDLNGFSGGGNALTTAEAVDYDMWRMYGVRQVQSIDAPFLSDPQSQCAPFAVALLNRARNEIHNGSLSIIGNEFMQPGEVIYLEDQDRLYYVSKVSHNITMGGSFETNLELSAGHMMGEYIPTYIDIIGKVLYKNKDITNYVNKKQDSVNSESHLGSFIGAMDGAFADSNKRILNSILTTAQSALADQATKLELRTYCASNHNIPTPPISLQYANDLRNIMVGSFSLPGIGKTLSGDDQPLLMTFSNQIPTPSSTIIDADFKGEGRSPSSAAYALARRWNGDTSDTIEKLEQTISTFVVDVFLVYSPIGSP